MVQTSSISSSNVQRKNTMKSGMFDEVKLSLVHSSRVGISAVGGYIEQVVLADDMDF